MAAERTYDQAFMVMPGVCFECEAPAAHRHHIVPASRGGKRVVWLCVPCHEKTHGMDEGTLSMMVNGRRAKIARGGYGGGHRYARRYGVRLVKVDGKLEYLPVPEEQAIIRRICETCPDGRGYRQMARTLNREEVPTVSGSPWLAKVVRDLALRGPDPL